MDKKEFEELCDAGIEAADKVMAEYDERDGKSGSIINALKRLERAGSEHSRTTAKLVTAANTLADHIIGQLIEMERDATSDLVAVLPQGVRYCVGPRRLCLGEDELGEDIAVGSETTTRSSALNFAHIVASGWLEQMAGWLEQQNAANEKAAGALK